MPVRINLLPKYVQLKRIFRLALMACIGGSLLWVLTLGLIYANTQVELNTLVKSTENVEPNALATEASQAAKSAADSAKAPIEANVKFIIAGSQTGAERSSLLSQFSHYFYPGSVVSQIDLSDGNSAAVQGMVKTPDDYARFITTLRQGTAPTGTIFARLPVGTNGIPGFPNLTTTTTTTGGDSNNSSADLSMIVFPLKVEARGDLLNPVTIPAAPGGAAAVTPTSASPEEGNFEEDMPADMPVPDG